MATGTKTKSRKPRPAARPGRGSKRAAAPDRVNWWEEAEEVPRSGLPDAEALEKRHKRIRRYVRTCVFATPILLFVTIVAVVSSLGEEEAPAPVTQAQFSQTKSDAIIAVRRWLASNPQPLPGGVLVGWDDATSEDVNPPENEEPSPENDYTVEVHHLTVASGGGSLYDTTVTLAVNDTIGAVVIGQPTLIAEPPSVGSFDASTWVGYDEISEPDAVGPSVQTWADAYSSGDPNALRLAVQDIDETRSYMPLTGATLGDAVVDRVFALWPEDADAVEREGTPPQVVVQATFSIRWLGQPNTEDNELPTVTYDLLVDKADTAAPVVVAWGGAGDGPSLRPYANAVDGRTIEAVPPEQLDENDPRLEDEGDVGSNTDGPTRGGGAGS